MLSKIVDIALPGIMPARRVSLFACRLARTAVAFIRIEGTTRTTSARASDANTITDAGSEQHVQCLLPAKAAASAFAAGLQAIV